MALHDLMQKRGELLDKRKALHERAVSERRDFTEAEQDLFDELGEQAEDYETRIARVLDCLSAFHARHPAAGAAACHQ